MAKLRLRIAKLFASDTDKIALGTILDNTSSDPNEAVLIVVNARFFSPFTVLKRKPAISQLYNAMALISEQCKRSGLSCRVVTRENLSHQISNKLVFSHHTFDEMYPQDFIANNSVYHFKSGDLPSAMTLDPNGFAGWSSIAQSSVTDLVDPSIPKSEIYSFFDRTSNKLKRENASKYPQPSDQSTSAAPKKPYVFVAMQTTNDVVQKNAYVDIFEMLDLIVDAFKNGPYTVVVKRHPKCKSLKMESMLQKIDRKNAHVCISDGSIHQILENASAVYSVNSGVGSEAMIYNLPIFCFGKSDYGAVATTITSRDGASELITNLTAKQSEEDLKRFYHFYRTSYQIDTPSALADKVQTILDSHSA